MLKFFRLRKNTCHKKKTHIQFNSATNVERYAIVVPQLPWNTPINSIIKCSSEFLSLCWARKTKPHLFDQMQFSFYTYLYYQKCILLSINAQRKKNFSWTRKKSYDERGKTYDERKTIRNNKKKLSETGKKLSETEKKLSQTGVKTFLERKFQRHGERKNEIDMVLD